MSDASDERAGDEQGAAGPADADEDAPTEEISTEQLRQQVEEKYDFEEFGPDDMAEMSADEWEAAFDPDTWITGEELLDRVEADLKYRVVIRDVFARVERLADGRVLAYSDEGYATVHPDGTVEGHGTVLRDVKPVVALCSMEEYDVPEMPEGEILPQPTEVPEGSGELGNIVMQVIAGVQVLAGLGLLLSWLLFAIGVLQPPTNSVGQDANLTLMVLAGLAFLAVGILLFGVVANARLSDKFRAEEYRNRLRAIGLESGERPDFLPIEDDEWVGDEPNRLETGTETADE
ncbi:DUF7319 domain-containing protein [Halorientalis salina]|uniref:DUF7319 domain-containing protein n=1 Tax=Halorientalis salina TaxID=2932266 RepID=UPI0010AB808E|nr:hypothetical protein [Halorientalis salina]